MKNKISLISMLYVFFIFFSIDNNSNVEILLKMMIIIFILVSLNIQESYKIFYLFYNLFYILFFLFFFSFFLAFNESNKYLANFLLIAMLTILPMYISVALNLLFKNYKDFFIYNFIFLINILFYVTKDFFGFNSGIINMNYTIFDITLFLIGSLQIIITFYFFIKNRKIKVKDIS